LENPLEFSNHVRLHGLKEGKVRLDNERAPLVEARILRIRYAAAPLPTAAQSKEASGGGAVLELANDALGDIAHGINRADHLRIRHALLRFATSTSGSNSSW
jgi:hypothetical protein